MQFSRVFGMRTPHNESYSVTPVARDPSPREFSRQPRILVRPQPGYYVMRLKRGAPLVAALIYQLCPMVLAEPTLLCGPHPDDWCRPLDRSRGYRALIDGKPAAIDSVWTARSLRPISRDEYQFRMGPLRHWARTGPQVPEAQPRRRIDFAALPPLF